MQFGLGWLGKGLGRGSVVSRSGVLVVEGSSVMVGRVEVLMRRWVRTGKEEEEEEMVMVVVGWEDLACLRLRVDEVEVRRALVGTGFFLGAFLATVFGVGITGEVGWR